MALTLAVAELPLARIRVGHAQGEAYSVVEIAVLATLIALPLGWAPVLALAVSDHLGAGRPHLDQGAVQHRQRGGRRRPGDAGVLGARRHDVPARLVVGARR